MEESDLLKERLQAITEKHRIQEDIRQKKLELDREKLKLQHLKKKALREQWLLHDSATHNATNSLQQQNLLLDQQETRELQLSIHRIEMEVESLEREESMVSTNESFILNRLKAVEKSSDDIIKEAQDSFVTEPLHVTTVIPDVPQCLSPPANKHSEPNTPRETLFAMEINVSKNLSTRESTVLSTAAVPLDELHQHAGLKVYDDGRKSVYALKSQEVSHDQSCVSELSATEVEQLLRSATVHRQAHQQNYHQTHSRRDGNGFYSNRDERAREEGCDVSLQRGPYSNDLLRNNIKENWQRKPKVDHHYGHQESHSNQKSGYYGSYPVRHSVQADHPVTCFTNGIIRGNSAVNTRRANGCPPPRSHDPEVTSACQPQLCYAPANYIPLKDYITVDEEDLYCFNSACYQSHDGNLPTAVYSGSTHCDRVPSPIYGDDTPYTILNAIETTEPITAIFMGFQMAQDDSGQGLEFEGSLKAELVIIDDNNDNGDENRMMEKNSHTQLGRSSYPTGSAANGNIGGAEGAGDRRTGRQVGTGIRKIKKKHKACCTVC